jgi:hypothetical protein
MFFFFGLVFFFLKSWVSGLFFGLGYPLGAFSSRALGWAFRGAVELGFVQEGHDETLCRGFVRL